ncbi:hypothetical protein [Bordetella flabilis]|uniref:Uncharacterized protein n=1 Tax=Bordetella flabilis TaxID=463014 RepID=A0A193GAF0_9BORD|nr:hypothetical protein [Bordetella flabilis]ANN76810.1 hypothetical protein BAU07_06500 [Bordetella flabilis]
MADTFTPHYNLVKPQVGGDPDTWGDLLNSNFDAIDTALFAKLDKAGGTLTGALTLPGNPTSALQAAPKQYVDQLRSDAAGAYYPRTGGNLAGQMNAPALLVDCSNGVGLVVQRAGVAAPRIRTEGDGSLAFINSANSAYNLVVSDSGQVNFPRARPVWAGVTPWDTGNFNPGAYQPAGNYARAADAHSYAFAWNGANAQLYVDNQYIGGLYSTNNFNPGNYQPVGSYVNYSGQPIRMQWDGNNSFNMYVGNVYVGDLNPL